MKACTKCRVVKPFEDFAPNKRTKDKLQSWCKSCKYAHDKMKRETDLDYKEARKNYWKSEKYKATRKAYLATEIGRRIIKNNRVKQKQDIARRRNYRIFYKLKSQNRVPGWVTPKECLPFYQLANSLGGEYVVDHIVPLRSNLVCGLHTPENLQVITKSQNEEKGVSLDEKWWPVKTR